MVGFCELAIGLCALGLIPARSKSPIVSREHLKNSRFQETAAGDRVRSALRGRRGSRDPAFLNQLTEGSGACCRRFGSAITRLWTPLPMASRAVGLPNASRTRTGNGLISYHDAEAARFLLAFIRWLQKIRIVPKCAHWWGSQMPFDINDTLTFEENLAAFVKSLEADDAKLAAVLAQKLPELLKGNIEPSDIWDALEVGSQEQAS